MSKKGFNTELFWENIVGILFASIVVVGVFLSTMWVARESPKDGSTKIITPPKNESQQY